MILKSSYIYQCGERYDKMRVITLQVSAVWYKSDWEGGGRVRILGGGKGEVVLQLAGVWHAGHHRGGG
jgi:hypothetical protein